MKKVNNAIFCLLLLLATVALSNAQSVKKPIKTGASIESVMTLKNQDYEDWQKIDLPSVTFYVPKELKKVDAKCEESGCYEFEGQTFKLNVDINFDAYRPRFEKGYPSYHEKITWIDKARGIYAWVWSFEEENKESKFRYHSGVLYVFKNRKNYLVNINVLSEHSDIKEIAEKIFKSVQFKTKDQRAARGTK